MSGVAVLAHSGWPQVREERKLFSEMEVDAAQTHTARPHGGRTREETSPQQAG